MTNAIILRLLFKAANQCLCSGSDINVPVISTLFVRTSQHSKDCNREDANCVDISMWKFPEC